MKRVRGAFALGCMALTACGSGSAAGGRLSGGAGFGAAGSGGTGTAGAGGLPMCQVDILPIVPASFDDLTAGPAATMRVRGAPSGPVSALFVWNWTVSLADGSPVPVTTVGNDPSLVEFPLATVGTFTIAVDLVGTGSDCKGLRTITAARPGAKVATFRVHVTPPSTVAVPAQDLQRQVMGGTPSGGNTLTLDNGIMVGFDVVRDDDGTALPSYVRLTDSTSGAVLETHTSKDGPNLLRVAQGTYSTLIVPDGDVAPIAFPPRNAAAFPAGSLAIDDGPMIAGTVTDASSQPVKGATIVLRAADNVSTTGTTDATGAFHLRARAGTFGVTVVTPLAAGGLEAKLAAANGLVVDATAPTPPLAIKLQTGALVTGAVALEGDPANLTTATRATLTTTGMANAATLTVGAGAPRALAGDVRLSLNLAADGTLSTGGVPPGSYALTIFPASASSLDGVTTATLNLPMSAGPMVVQLAQKVMLTGKLLPAAEAWGVRLVALDDGGLPIESEGDSAPDGSFALAVSPFRTYQLRALPRPDQALARASFPVVMVLGASPPAQDHDMPAALLFAGRVVDPSLQGVSTALVQAYCFATAPGCDPTVPVAETITRSDGTFQLMLPDPDGTP